MKNELALLELSLRVKALESQNARMKFACVCGFLLLCSLPLVMAANTSKTIEAERFILTTADGKKVAILGTVDDGPAFQLYDAKGRVRSSLDLRNDEPTLEFCDQQQQNRIKLCIVKEGPKIYLTSGKDDSSVLLESLGQKSRFSLGYKGISVGEVASDRFSAGLTLADERHKRILLNCDGEGSSIRLADEKGKGRFAVVAQSTQAGVGLADAAGNTRLEFKSLQDTNSLQIFNPKANLRLFFGMSEDKPLLTIKDEKGEVEFLKP